MTFWAFLDGFRWRFLARRTRKRWPQEAWVDFYVPVIGERVSKIWSGKIFRAIRHDDGAETLSIWVPPGTECNPGLTAMSFDIAPQFVVRRVP